jgi:hypothetical protein
MKPDLQNSSLMENFMKKIIFALIVSFFSTFAHATTPVCEMKRSEYERAQCYQFAVKGGMIRIEKNYAIMAKSPKIPAEYMQDMNAKHDKWSTKVEDRCSTNECLYDAIAARNNEIEKYMRSHGVQPY